MNTKDKAAGVDARKEMHYRATQMCDTDYSRAKQIAYDEDERQNRIAMAGGVGSGKLRRTPTNITPKKKKRK